MKSKTLIHKALSLCLIVAIYATYSMTALAGSERIAGELLISGKNSNVTVNGETAQNGRSIFSASTVTTSENANAIINLGKIGKIELAPNSTLTISFNEKGISGNLLGGKVTVLGANEAVSITTSEGKTVKLAAGESMTTGKTQQDDDAAASGGGSGWWIWAAVFGGAVAGIVLAATTDNNRAALGGGTTVVSPSR